MRTTNQPRAHLRAIAAALLLGLLVAGCGSGDDTSEASEQTVADTTADTTGTTDVAADDTPDPGDVDADPTEPVGDTEPAEQADAEQTASAGAVTDETCPTPPYTVLARFEGGGPLEPFEITDAVALQDGPLVTLIVTSGATIDRQTDFLRGFPEVPDDAVMLQMGIFSGEDVSGEPPLAAGDTFASGDPRNPTLGVVQGAPSGGSSGAQQMATVQEADGSSICIHFDMTSETGVAFQGPVVAEYAG